MKSARANSSSSSTFSTPSATRALRRQERIVGDHLHLEAERAVGDDRADIAAADDAERLAGELDAHEARLLPLAGLGRAVGRRECRAPARTSCAIACSAVVIELPNGVFITTMPRCVAAGTSTLSTPMPARPTTFSLAAASSTSASSPWWPSARPARRYSPMIAFSSSGVRPVLIVDLDAALVEDLDGARGQLVGDQDFGHGETSP